MGGCAGPGLGPWPGPGTWPRAHGPWADRPGAQIGVSLPQIRGDAALKSWNVNGGIVKDLLGVFLRSRQRVIRQLGVLGIDVLIFRFLISADPLTSLDPLPSARQMHESNSSGKQPGPLDPRTLFYSPDLLVCGTGGDGEERGGEGRGTGSGE